MGQVHRQEIQETEVRDNAHRHERPQGRQRPVREWARRFALLFMLDPLVGGVGVVAHRGAHADDLVGGAAGADAATANQQAALDVAGRDLVGMWCGSLDVDRRARDAYTASAGGELVSTCTLPPRGLQTGSPPCV